MWSTILKEMSIDEHIDILLPKIYSQLEKQGYTNITEEQLEEALVSFIKEQVFGNKVSWQQFLKV
mgnify:FL=1|jgi:hypothetical protein|tara:strand:+ start:462 stop:656 length:195 start_codon:yes stop_codon:yes gene_type:complete